MNVFTPIEPHCLSKAVDDLKKRNRGGILLTNYFLQSLDKVANLRMSESGHSLCFMHNEWDFSRVYFYSFDLGDLAGMLGAIDWPSIVVADWLSKQGNGDVDNILVGSGFHLHAIYDRIICLNLKRYRQNSHLLFADLKDQDELHLLLFQVFDKYGDHIIRLEELGRLIRDRQIIISRDSANRISGFVIYRMESQKCNFYFLYHSGNPLDLSFLLGNFYGTLSEKNVQSGFSWVRRTRSTVMRLHQSFGWRTDGLVDYVYLR